MYTNTKQNKTVLRASSLRDDGWLIGTAYTYVTCDWGLQASTDRWEVFNEFRLKLLVLKMLVYNL